MLIRRVHTDFNTMNVYVGLDDFLVDERRRVWLTHQSFFSPDSRVILFQDDNDFEVQGTLAHDNRFGQNEGWYAIIDWSTRREIGRD